MTILVSLGYLLLGFALLVWAGDFLVKAAISLAVRTRLSPATIGLTVIAAGTSAPELVTSLIAAAKETPDIAIGNVIGSNVFNILAIVGVSCLIQPNLVEKQTLKVDWPFLFLTSVFTIWIGWSGSYSRLEGLTLLLLLASFIAYTIWITRRKGLEVSTDEDIEVLKHIGLDFLYLILGFAGLTFGANFALEGGVELGRLAGLSERVIGITIISVGTGLPELATSVMAAWRGRNDIALSNVIGSNMFNTMGIIGTTAMVHPIKASPQLITIDGLWMLAATFVLFPLMRFSRGTITRPSGGFLLILYVAYIVMLILNP